jgi:coatomer subunit beta
VQVDNLLTFRQFLKESADDATDVCDLKKLREPRDEDTYRFFPQHDEDVGRATGSTEIREDSTSNLSRILQLTGCSPVTICFYLLCYKI